MTLQLDDAAYATLNERVADIHRHVLEVAPSVVRVACALYDAETDLLKTFLGSTHVGELLTGYQARLSDSHSLDALAREGGARLWEDVEERELPSTAHSEWLQRQGYRSSFTVPMRHDGALLGFMFFDSVEDDCFSAPVQRELVLCSTLVGFAVAREVVAVRSILGAVDVAREFTSLRDAETGAHLERVARYARVVAQRVAHDRGLPDEWVERVFLYAPLHDVGKVAVPDGILLKPGALTPDEWEVMKTHTTRGRDMIELIVRDLHLDRSVTQPDMMLHIVELHHEKWDGSGYPRGLRGDEIPLEARVVAVADILDALVCHRPYKRAWTWDAAFDQLMIERDSGKLDPACVDALIASRDELEQIARTFPDHD
jgi:HD-GYP domain-containing protein (c-di-GMP phosphodiesterase class II)